MSLVDHLLSTRTPLELAKEAVATAKENAALRQRAHELETELFWMKARERDIINIAGRILRDALDDVRVHVCDQCNDDIRAQGLYGDMRDLYRAMK